VDEIRRAEEKKREYMKIKHAFERIHEDGKKGTMSNDNVSPCKEKIR